MKARCLLLPAILHAGLLIAANSGRAQGTAFTYQGSLSDSDHPANGQYDLQFTVLDAATNGNSVSGTITNLATAVSNGLFTSALDFGSNVFNGPARWLEIGVRTNGNAGSFAILAPRQQLTPAPYAITAATISGALPATQLSGTLSSGQLGGVYTGAVVFSNSANSFVGNAGGATNLQAGQLTGTVPIANGGTGQTNPGAALSALGGASLTGSNPFSGGLNSFLNFSLAAQGIYGGLTYSNNGTGGAFQSPQDNNSSIFINPGHGGSGNGVEWQMTVNQMYFGPVNGGHFQFGLSSDNLGDALAMQWIGSTGSNYNRSHALAWHNKYSALSGSGDLFWDAWSETYNVTVGSTVLHFTLPIGGGNQDYHTVGTLSGLTLDSDTGVEMPGYTRVGYTAVQPLTTNCAINLTNQQFAEYDLTQPANFYETNLNLYGHFANPVALNKTLLIYSGPGGSEPVAFPGNWIWFNDNGSAVAPVSVPAATIMRVDLTITVGVVTNRLAHVSLGAYSPGYDANAQAYLAAAGITNNAQQGTVNNLVISLKTTPSSLGGSLWSRLDAFYPFLGATANSASWNLINPAVYRITWHGSPVFNSLGVTGDGATAYGDTGLNPATAASPNYTQNSASLGAYLQNPGAAGPQNSFFGAVDGAANRASIYYNGANFVLDGMNSGNNVLGTLASSTGLVMGVRLSSTVGNFVVGGTSDQGTATTSTGAPNATFYVLARNNGGPQFPINATEGCFFIGGAFSITDVSNLNTNILAYVTALGRQ